MKRRTVCNYEELSAIIQKASQVERDRVASLQQSEIDAVAGGIDVTSGGQTTYSRPAGFVPTNSLSSTK